jgi:hypothetical protein
MRSIINNELVVQNPFFGRHNKLTCEVDVSRRQIARINFISNEHINRLKDGLHFDASLECQRNQLKVSDRS